MELTQYLEACLKYDASDLHISPGQPPIIRIDGDLAPIKDMPVLDANTTKNLILSI